MRHSVVMIVVANISYKEIRGTAMGIVQMVSSVCRCLVRERVSGES